MKKTLLLFAVILLAQLKPQAQVEVWDWQGYSIGVNAQGAAYAPMGAMPDIIRINSLYYMYYIAKSGNANAIFYATSPDLITWTVKDTIMKASADTTNRIYDLGGPGVLKLNNGQYRLFYRTAQKSTPPNEPLFHIRSMISNNGVVFTHEAGVRVEVKTYSATSYFKSASHPAVYKDANGNTKAIITGRDTTMNINSPAGLYTASSNDEGLTWGNFVPLYAKCHDPVVIKDSANKYHMYTSYLGSGHREAVSNDGITWPVTADSMLIRKAGVPLNEQTSSSIIADLGAAVKPNGEIILYSNFKPIGPGAWVNIAYYFPASVGIKENGNSGAFNVYPNPANNVFSINTSLEEEIELSFFNLYGELVHTGSFSNTTSIETSTWEKGIYFYRLKTKQGNNFTGKIVIE